jgi:PAS domain S-box-containing protein
LLNLRKKQQRATALYPKKESMLAKYFPEVTLSVDKPTEHTVLLLISLITCGLVIAIGLLVLIGWANDIELLKRIHPTFTAMNPLSAVCLIIGGISILLARYRWQRAASSAGVFILIIAGIKAADIAWGGLPVDQLLFARSLGGGSGLPNAMAPNTAFAFLLLALSLLSATSKRRILGLISQGLSTAVLAISIFALIGYAFGINHLNSVGPFIPMALHTSLGLALLSTGLMSLTPHCGLMVVLRDTGAAGSMARTVLPLAIFVPVVVGGMRLWGQNSGYYGTEVGVALQVIANVLVTSILLTSSIIALHRSDRIRLRREQDIARSEASYRLAEEVAQVGHWRMDAFSRQLSWSDEVFRLAGISIDCGVPSVGNILDVYHPEDRSFVRQSVRDALREGRDWEYRVRLNRPDGEVRLVTSRGVCERDEDGKLTGLFGVFADVTDLEHARCKAEEASAAKAAFLANMSHEIRTPLNGVMGFAELLLASELAVEQKRHATLIFDSAQSLLKLLNDILDVSKTDAGQLEIAQEPFDLSHQLRQCVQLMDGMAQTKGLTLTLVIDPQLPKDIVGDGIRLRQIVLNLLGNAIKFTAAGSVIIEAISEVSDTGVPLVQINVTDTGVGIPEARQASVFEEFVQADVSTARRFGGSGLGLSISRRLVALMGGEIRLASREGEGTQVTLCIPLIAATHPLLQSSDNAIEPFAPPPGDSTQSSVITILLAEDLDINQELITDMLDRMGYKAEIANNGEEAIRLAGRLRGQPDAYGLILMDIQMPVVDGLTATRAIRAQGGRASSIPIVALTANAYASDISECHGAGMVDHLAKPVSMSSLGAALAKWLGKAELSSAYKRAGSTTEFSLADKFTQRKATYDERLVELQGALQRVGANDRERLIAEVENIAHNLAGTAAMFGEQRLGEQAAAVEDNLRAKEQSSATCIDDLLAALRRQHSAADFSPLG